MPGKGKIATQIECEEQKRAMTQLNPNRPLKVCHTCRHWIYRYKGLCERLGQGVGKFWHCEDWTAPAGNPGKAENPEKGA